MFVADKWKDFEVISCSRGEKYERWGDIYLRRPDPQAIWPIDDFEKICKPHAVYSRSSSGGGSWTKLKSMPSTWKIGYNSLGRELTFIIEPTSFKHTGLFPEQAANWDYCGRLIDQAVRAGRKDIRILNLFAYTGGATVAASAHGAAEVVHVDASKGMIARAKENVAASGLSDNYIRFIAEDCQKFVEREIRRGRRYDGIIMDPPAYGRGPSGELWKLEDSIFEFVSRAGLLLSDDPLFFLISCYATEITGEAVAQVAKLALPSGNVECGELGLPVIRHDICLPCGYVTRWSPF
ncbi:23S rRNA (cytosine1962-C5)-methyltransferase [Ruminococcaceae bacterium YRB3002]|nr:23S rRNA (cytosine1962-C5)-methyltransferase [Ruminococcaceae bacterium YRB3002]